MAVSSNTGGAIGRRMVRVVSVNAQPFVSYVYQVNERLRRIHGMGRFASEWYCYRRLGHIQTAFSKKRDINILASDLSTEWPGSVYQRDYAALRHSDPAPKEG